MQKIIKADLNNLIISYIFVNWNSIKKWIFQKPLKTRPFKNRLDSLEQIRLAPSTINGSEPNFIQKSSLLLLREQHNREHRKFKNLDLTKSLQILEEYQQKMKIILLINFFVLKRSQKRILRT